MHSLAPGFRRGCFAASLAAFTADWVRCEVAAALATATCEKGKDGGGAVTNGGSVEATTGFELPWEIMGFGTPDGNVEVFAGCDVVGFVAGTDTD